MDDVTGSQQRHNPEYRNSLVEHSTAQAISSYYYSSLFLMEHRSSTSTRHLPYLKYYLLPLLPRTVYLPKVKSLRNSTKIQGVLQRPPPPRPLTLCTTVGLRVCLYVRKASGVQANSNHHHSTREEKRAVMCATR